ncbi:MAG TPA: XamI family restriction endonuclease, partial [Pirellulales bacterium]|nr:XamI family restriction endonuclease [Pirellulales bacterium]
RKLEENLARMVGVITKLLDHDILPWLEKGRRPTDEERHRASTIVADRRCGALTDPIIRNAQERRQLEVIEKFLRKRGYKKQQLAPGKPLEEMQPGTFCFRLNVAVGDASRSLNIPIDVVIQPFQPRPGQLPILIEAKSAGDFTNTNKRRKEEATKIHQLRATCGDEVQYVLFLCGYFDSGYLGYEAAEGIDWIWEHRIEDMKQLGV